MDSRQTAQNLVQASLLLDESKKAEICTLLKDDTVSEDYIQSVLKILERELEDVGQVVEQMSDEDVAQLTQAIAAAQSTSTRNAASQELEESAQQAESLLDPVTLAS